MMVLGAVCSQVSCLSRFGGLCRAVPEAEAVVSGLQDVAVMGEPIEQSGGHLDVAEDGDRARRRINAARFLSSFVQLRPAMGRP
jgi:hypothetical protein